MILRPIAFVASEGDIWQPWTGPKTISESFLEGTLILKDYSIGGLTLNGIKLHAIKFEGGNVWDCVNGWRLQQEYRSY